MCMLVKGRTKMLHNNIHTIYFKSILSGIVLTLLCGTQHLEGTPISFPNEAATIPIYGRCITPNGERALCINLENCKYLYNLLLSSTLHENVKLFLRRSQCGYIQTQVLICCSAERLELENSLTIIESDPTVDLLPPPGQCGNSLINRIYGGQKTSIDEYPWMALIEFTKNGGYKGYHCGGSLINQRYVVTASHCVNGRSIPRRWTLTGVRLGEWDTKTNPDCKTDQRGYKDCAPPHIDVPVERIIPHPQYIPNSNNQVNDIALLRLARNIVYTDFVRPICLPLVEHLRTSTFEHINLDVAGWGKTKKASTSSMKMRATVSGVPLQECYNTYKRQGIELTNSQMCAGGIEGVDSCRGDSGGPLVALDRSNKVNAYYFLAGIVSFGPTPCGLGGWPGVYTRVGEYVEWIRNTLEP